MNDLKKVLLAGIGLTAMTVDKADKEEAQEFLNKLDAKKSSVEYATKEDVKRLEEKLDALLSQNK